MPNENTQQGNNPQQDRLQPKQQQGGQRFDKLEQNQQTGVTQAQPTGRTGESSPTVTSHIDEADKMTDAGQTGRAAGASAGQGQSQGNQGQGADANAWRASDDTDANPDDVRGAHQQSGRGMNSETDREGERQSGGQQSGTSGTQGGM